MSVSEVVIVDYGMGNLFSIDRAISYVGGRGVVSSDPQRISKADRLILPGVGAFGRGMDELRGRNLIEPLLSFVQTGRPLLGICLGMQFLMAQSYEFGEHQGLNVMPGSVLKFDDAEGSVKVPHIGWNDVSFSNGENGRFYFVHSYFVLPEHKEDIWGQTRYGENRFCSAIKRDQIMGYQFHPERSGPQGLKLLKQFLNT